MANLDSEGNSCRDIPGPVSSPKLVSFKLCPYVQKSLIVLLEQQIEFEIEYIDLSNKPKWFLEISPTGKVPLLQVDGQNLFESNVICEFIDETSGSPMMPTCAIERAKHRAWIQFSGEMFSPMYRLMVEKNRSIVTMHIERLQELFTIMEDELHEGEFFDSKFSLVDASIAPVFQRLSWINEKHTIDFFEGVPKMKRWSDALVARPSVHQSVVDNIVPLFWQYLTDAGAALAT